MKIIKLKTQDKTKQAIFNGAKNFDIEMGKINPEEDQQDKTKRKFSIKKLKTITEK